MALLNDVNQDARMKQIRAGVRLNSRVKVAVEWTEEGRKLRVEGFTVDVSPKGCLAVIPQGFTVGQHMKLINLTNQKANDAVVIWRGHEGRTGWELGIELIEPEFDYWGLEF